MTDQPRWLLLIHQIPPKPDYFRVKVRRRLQRLGAVALKNAVYALPSGDETLEDFQWLRGEIADEGGEAILVAASLLEGVSDAEVEERGRAERDAEYREMVAAARAAGPDDVERLERQLAEVVRRDHWDAPGRQAAEQAVARLPRGAGAAAPPPAGPIPVGGGRTWVTRAGVRVDRIASAWLIRRFVDPEARFKFVPARGYVPEPGELRFDMYEGEFTHEGDRCTFETLLLRLAPDDGALRALAELVHDVDLKDDRFGRPEAAGFAAVIEGLAQVHASDADRLAAGAALLDGLYARFRRGA